MIDQPKVLVIDDEHSIRYMLDVGLQREGFDVRCASDGRQALSLLSKWSPDVVILDVMMPFIDGFALLPMLRQRTNAPILMLSAKGDIPDRVTGLTLGADDYLAKPFAFEELLARLQAALRRPYLTTGEMLRFADLTVNLTTRDVERAGRHIKLTNREFSLLVAFLREPRRVFTREQLLDVVWGRDYEGEISVVDTYVSYLRAKIDVDGLTRLIQTVRGAGYTLREGDSG